MDATAATTATAPSSIATTQNLPAPVVRALTERTANDPALHSLVDRILNGHAGGVPQDPAPAVDHAEGQEAADTMSQLKGLHAGAFAVPSITETDLFSFHEAHFGEAALATFANDFLDPNKARRNDENQHGNQYDQEYCEEEYYNEGEEDDGLGYYPDGVKRTLTDEQISMFRHSELQRLQRAREKAQDKPLRKSNSSSPIPVDVEEGEAEEGELPDDGSHLAPVAKSKKRPKKKKRGSGNSNKRWEPDPERRKRTWDVVETGLDGLDYGETQQSASPPEHIAQRRRIKYDDG